MALEKVRGLLRAGARTTVIASALSAELASLRDAGSVEHVGRDYREGDMEGFAIVMGADGDRMLNARLQREGRERGIWVNAADDPSHCDFILPSVVREGRLTLALSTGGGSPAVARRLREELGDYLSADGVSGATGELTGLVSEVRGELRDRGVFGAIGSEAWQEAMDGRLRALAAQRRRGQAKALLLARLGAPLFGAAEEDPRRLLDPCRRGPVAG